MPENNSYKTAGIVVANLWSPETDSIFYIDPTNSLDDSKDGSLNHPFSSYDELVWKEGYVYAIKRGTQLDVDVFMVYADGVTIASYGESNKRPIINCSTEAHGVSTDWQGSRGLTILDLEIIAEQGTSCVIFRDNSENCKLINCILHGAYWGLRALNDIDGIYVTNTEIYDINDDGIFMKNAENIEISHCYIHNVNTNWVPPFTPEVDAAGDGIQFYLCNRWHVHHNIVDRSSSGNKFCFISNNANQNDGVVEYNKFLGPIAPGFSVYVEDGKDIIIRYNYMEFAECPIYTHSKDMFIYYNIFNNMSGPLFASNSAKVYNNLFYNMSSGIQGGKIEAINNIFSLDYNKDSRFDKIMFKVEDMTESNNLFMSGSDSENSFIGDPAFVNAEGNDFHLMEISDCIDRGFDLNFEFDIEGNTVPNGTAPEIGPYEYLK